MCLFYHVIIFLQGRRSQTLPSGMTHSYPPYQEQQGPAQRAKSADRSRSLPRGQGPDYGYITYHAADRVQVMLINSAAKF